MERLTVLCFAGTYGLALLSELARFAVRGAARARWWTTVGLMVLAWVVQTAYLANLSRVSGHAPITTVFESLVALSWIFAAIGLYLMVHTPKAAIGMFVLPIVVALSSVAGLAAPRRADWGTAWDGATSFWGSLHGAFLLAGAASTCVAFVAGLMYLAQASRLKAKRASRFALALPNLELSERLNRGAVVIAFPLLTFGLLVGLVLSLTAQPGAAASLSWTDPKVLSALAMWLVFALLLHARFRPSMRGRGVVVLTIVAFALLVFTWIGLDVLRIPTAHGVARTAAADAGRPR